MPSQRAQPPVRPTREPRAPARPPGIGGLEQRHLDLLGLALVALAALLAFVVYLGWDGGAVGEGVIAVALLLFGLVGYLTPVALFAAGALIVLGPLLPTVRPFRTGFLCLLLGGCLGLAAESFGLGPDRPARDEPFEDEAFLRHHGGLLGESMFWVTRLLVQQVGTDILVVFLVVGGVLLLTGASVAGVLVATRRGVSSTTRRVRESTSEFAAVIVAKARGAGDGEPDTLATVPEGPDGFDAPDADRTRPGAVALGRRGGLARPAPADRVGDDPVGGPLAAGPFAPSAEDEPTVIDGDAEFFAEDLDEPPAPAQRPPEVEPVVRATHVEAPALDGEPPAPDLPSRPRPSRPDDEPLEPEDPARAPSDDAPPEPRPRRSYAPEDLTPQGRLRSRVTEADDFVYEVPPASVLTRSSTALKVDTKEEARTGAQVVEALGHFGVDAQVVGTVSGPHVTRHELRLAPGIKMSKVATLKDDLAYALAATDVRILAPIPGKQAVGVEVPNRVRRIVHLGDVFQAAPAGWSPLTVWLGKDIAGKAIGTDLAKQPHVLVAGTTGSGKSGCVNAMLSSILLRATPNEVRLVLVDPKQVELNHYESVPHLLTPVVTSPRIAANVLANLIREMEQRYSVMSLARARNLVELNRIREQRGERPLPYILCVIDELADLMMVAPAEVEDSIIRLAQKSRAVGIHLVLATQRPSADIITGMIKANVPARIAFAVSSQTDSRVILDSGGAESLLGQGDMLFRPASESRTSRIQGAFISEAEIEQLTDFWRDQGEPELQEELLEATEGEGDAEAEEFHPDADDLLGEAIATVVQLGSASTSMLQRRLRVGYTRAGRLIDMMERRGVVSGYEGSKARQVMITEADLPRVLAALEEPVGAGDP